MTTGDPVGSHRQWYTVGTLTAMLVGRPPGTEVKVTVHDPNGHRFKGRIIGISEATGLVDVRTDAGMIIEGVRTTWILHAEVG